MIKYNKKTINDWKFDSSNIVKVYHNGAVCYYKLEGSPTPTGQTPCYAVVDDITQYSSTEFVDVFDKATEKWYKLNNLNQYEEYGLYGEGRDITHYEGKLTIDGGYEYEYSNGDWVNRGEVMIKTLPNVPFTVNYNAKNYDASTKTFAKTEGQLANTDVTVSGTLTAHDGYVTVSGGSRGIISGYDDYFNRTNSTPNLTIISKQRTENDGNCHMFGNRTSSNYNWMYRPYSHWLTLYGGSIEHGSVAVTTQPVIESVRVYSDRSVTYNNYTDNTSNSLSGFNYGSPNGSVALFAGSTNSSGEWFVGDFYWIYMSQSTLTDEQVQEVINYNEEYGGYEYPIYYAERQSPPKELVFNTMEEALEYQCPYLGVVATIGGVKYKFTYDEQYDTYQWSEITESFQVNLNSQWQSSISYGSISDTGNYDFYQSFSNKGVNNGKAMMFITIYGYTSFTFKVRNYSESGWDFVVVNNIDDRSIPKWRPIGVGSGIASSGYVYYSNSGNSSNATWYDVTFSNLDGGEHTITITYGKDGSGNSNDDRGYVAIPKTQ